jgi:DNA-binding PadR family transcriptional regulator
MADLTGTELHLLLALGSGPSYGYRLQQRVEEESGGELSPDIGSLYRTLSRLMERGWVEEVPPPPDADGPTPGRPRRYYALAPEGRRALSEEVARLEHVVALARARDVAPDRAG